MKTLNDLNFTNKKVLLRVDFNLPLDKEGQIVDDTRIRESLPTIKTILQRGGTLILMSHMGRPKGEKNPSLTLFPCVERLSKFLNQPVLFIKDCIGPEVEKKVASLQSGEVLLLENLRFYPAEEKPDLDPSFAQNLAKLGEVYVNDAFGSAHRIHSSTYEVPKLFPNKKAAGLLMEKEYSYLNTLFFHPKHPFFAILGGSKISSKFDLLKALIAKVDALFIGGAMAFTLLKAEGFSIGDSICENDLLEEARSLLQTSKIKIFLPIDSVISNSPAEPSQIKIISMKEGIPLGWKGMDIGPQTIQQWSHSLSTASTLFWNGPLGLFEIPSFAKGTHEIAKIVSSLSATTVIGGGDSLAAIHSLHLDPFFSHLSTGGGACLEFLKSGHLPGIDILS